LVPTKQFLICSVIWGTTWYISDYFDAFLIHV
jgi:hypothetical protein